MIVVLNNFKNPIPVIGLLIYLYT